MATIRRVVRIRVRHRPGKWTMSAIARPDRHPSGVAVNVMRLWNRVQRARASSRGLPWITSARYFAWQERRARRAHV